MKILLSLLFSFAATAAQAHESSVPHQHPHGISPLPDLEMLIVGSVLMIAVTLIAYMQFRQR